MDKTDITDILIQRGVDQDAANRLKGEINGNDLMRLIAALSDKRAPASSDATAQRILGKYGIKLGGGKMANKNDYLKAKFESLRGGRSLDETFGFMVPLSESFSYAVEVSEDSRDRVLDWLDENQVEYQATSATNYRIECGDRDVAYRTGRALAEILRKPTVRDSVQVEEKMSKNPDKRVKDAKAKMADMKPRNPVVQAMAASGKNGSVHKDKDARKEQGRKAKYKPRFDEEIESIEAELTEGVMAMKPVNPLFRLRELAGLPLSGKQDDIDGIEIADAPPIDPEGILAPGPVGGEPEVDGLGQDPVADPMDDMDGGMDAPTDTIPDINDDSMPDSDLDVSGGAEPLGDLGVPGELGSDPVEPVVPGMDAPMGSGLDGMAQVPTQSDAMSQIEDALNSIQVGLADIRLSEYKSLIKKLQDLTNQAQMMGRDYLGERRKK